MAGYRDFQTGEVLTAANVNDFLMEQAVMTFADDAARTTALTDVLREGLLTYNLDTNRLEVYDGSAWVEPAPEPPAGIGSNVVQAFKTDTFATSSTAFTDITDLEVTITPSSDTAKVLLIAQISSVNGTWGANFRWMRDTSPVGIADAVGNRGRASFGTFNGNTATTFGQSVAGVYLDSPETTSPVTYKLQMVTQGTNTLGVTGDDADLAARPRSTQSITAIEVAA